IIMKQNLTSDKDLDIKNEFMIADEIINSMMNISSINHDSMYTSKLIDSRKIKSTYSLDTHDLH
ncbi:13827_t:CDS:2, partial [Dentiscutata heterogama]